MLRQKLLNTFGRLETLVLLGIPLVALTRPKEEFIPSFAFIVALAVAIHFIAHWRTRDRAAHWLVTVSNILGLESDKTLVRLPTIRLAALFTFMGVAYLGQLMIFYGPRETRVGYLLMVTGVVGTVALLIRSCYRQQLLDSTSTLIPPVSQPWWRIQRPWLYLALLLMVYLASQAINQERIGTVFEHLLFWILALTALVMAFRQRRSAINNAIDDIVLDHDVNVERDRMPRWEVMLIIALFVVALLVRGINLANEPGPYDGDEANFWEVAVSALGGEVEINPFHHGWDSYSNLQSSLIAISMKFLGVNAFASRVPAVLIGTLTVIALYLLGRELYGWQTGLLCALFAIGWAFHIQFSRLTLNQGGDALFGTLTMYFLLRGLRRRSGFDYALCGIMLGIAQLFYLAATHLIIVVVGYLVFLFIFQRRTILRQWRLLWIIPFACFIALFPRLFYIWYNNLQFTYHTNVSIIFSGELERKVQEGTLSQYVLDQFAHSYLALFSQPDMTNWYGQGSNLMSPVGGPLLLIGTVITLVMIRKRPYLIFPVMWTATAIFISGTLTTIPPSYQRYYTGSSAYALLVGVGLSAVTWGIHRLTPRPSQYRQVLTAVGGTVLVLGLTFYLFYFVRNNNYLKTPPPVSANRVSESMLTAKARGMQILLMEKFATGVENGPIVKYMMDNDPYLLVPEGVTIDDIVNVNQVDLTRPIALIIPPSRLPEARQFIQKLPNSSAITLKAVPMIDIEGISHYLIMSPGIGGNGKSEVTNVLALIPTMTSTATLLPTETPLAEPGRCISIAGEAAASGYARLEVPPSGSWLVQFRPISHYLQLKLDEIGFTDVPIYDRTVIAGAIGPGIQETVSDYMQSVIYQELLSDRCRVTIIMPWLSDLTSASEPSEASAAHYVGRLRNLLHELLITTTDKTILLVKYYPAQVSAFMKETDGGVMPENIALYNEQLNEICESTTADWDRVTCVDPMAVFKDMDDYLLTSLTYDEIKADMVNTETMSVADSYFANNPDATELLADGIHLSHKAKVALANKLAEDIQRLLVASVSNR